MRHKNQSNEFIMDCIAVSYVRLLYERPKEEITVTDICMKSGFGRATYYRHFGNDRNELIVYIAKRKWEEYKKEHSDAVKKDEGFELVVHCHNNKEFMLMLRRQNMIELLYRILFEISGNGENENPVFRYAKDIFVGMYFGVIYDWILMGCKDTPMEIKSKIQQGIELAVKMEKEKNSKNEKMHD